MGRVFEALRRASNNEPSTPKRPKSDSDHRNGAADQSGPSVQELEEQLFGSSTIFSGLNEAVNRSASTAHTTDVTDGSALPGGIASRDAGATLGAAGAARADGFVSYDISTARVEPHVVAISQPRSVYCEQFRSLRTRVLQAGEQQQMRAIVITSAGLGEGKTITALNLAWLLAQSEGIRALLIDSDLRNPCAADYLGIEAPVGLSEVLSGQVRFGDAIVRLDPAGLYLLPGGQPRDDVADVLGGPTYTRLLTDARRMFDYVIIDAPPLGIFTDANVLIGRADGALMVVRSGKTRYSVLDELLEPLPKERLLGVVLNRADEQLDSEAYYYHHRYRSRLDNQVPKQLPSKAEEEATVVS
jgi:capsular exopolysaccharide synthesis family protein